MILFDYNRVELKIGIIIVIEIILVVDCKYETYFIIIHLFLEIVVRVIRINIINNFEIIIGS